MKRKPYFTCSCGRRYMKKETAMCCVTSGCKRCGKVTKPQMANTYVRGTKKAHNVDYRGNHLRPVFRKVKPKAKETGGKDDNLYVVHRLVSNGRKQSLHYHAARTLRARSVGKVQSRLKGA